MNWDFFFKPSSIDLISFHKNILLSSLLYNVMQQNIYKSHKKRGRLNCMARFEPKTSGCELVLTTRPCHILSQEYLKLLVLN